MKIEGIVIGAGDMMYKFLDVFELIICEIRPRSRRSVAWFVACMWLALGFIAASPRSCVKLHTALKKKSSKGKK